MPKYDRFTLGKSTFKCQLCHRMTRDTGQGVDHLCHECFDICSLDNQVNDCRFDPDIGEEKARAEVLGECESLLANIGKRGGDVDNVKKHNRFIWPKA